MNSPISFNTSIRRGMGTNAYPIVSPVLLKRDGILLRYGWTSETIVSTETSNSDVSLTLALSRPHTSRN